MVQDGHAHIAKPKENQGFQPQTPVFRTAWLGTLLLRFDGIRMQNASAALLNWFQDGHANVGTPKENLRKTKVFSLRPQSSGPPGWGRTRIMFANRMGNARPSLAAKKGQALAGQKFFERSAKKRTRHSIYTNSRSTAKGRPLLVANL